MSAQPEAWREPIEPEIEFSIDDIRVGIQAMAFEKSEKFRLGKLPIIGDTADFETPDGTTFLLTWHAAHTHDDQTDVPLGIRYNLNLQVTHSFDGFMPQELVEALHGEGTELPDPDIIEKLDADYELDMYISPSGLLEWMEDRSYDLRLVDENEPDDAEEAEARWQSTDPEVIRQLNKLHTNHQIKLGEYIKDAEDRKELPADVTPLTDDFVAFLGTIGLQSSLNTYPAKASNLYGLLSNFFDADHDLNDYFTGDVVEAIKLGLYRSE